MARKRKHREAATAPMVPETPEGVAAEEERQMREGPVALPPGLMEPKMPRRKDDGGGKKVIPLEERKFTLDQYVRRKGDLGQAFRASALLEDGGKVIKLTRDEWDTRYAKWLKTPRG